jgi:hypothetical protein
MFLQVECDHTKFSDPGFTRDVAKNRREGAGVNGLQGRGLRILRREVDEHLHIQRSFIGHALNWRLVFELFPVARSDFAPAQIES